MTALFKPGDYVIYRKHKFTVHPGRHAKEIRPSAYGDYYSYDVDKYWLVIAVEASNHITVCTRKGKRLTLNAADPALRRAGWLERVLFRNRFPVAMVNSAAAAH